MKLLVLNNLSSGLGDGAVYDFMRAFAQPEDEFIVRCVDQNSSFADALADVGDFDALIAAGGDGTVASACYLTRYSGVPVLAFPAGTANLLAQNIHSPIEPHALAKLTRNGKRLDFDLGELTTDKGTFGFSMMAGCGYDAKIMGDAKALKKRWGAAAYFKAAFANPSPQVSKFDIEIDGVHHKHEGVGVLLLNFSKIQFDISIGLENNPNDGELDVLVLTTQTAWDLLPPVIGAAFDHSGKPLKASNALVFYRGKNINVVADPPMPVQYDGEPVEATTPYTARVLPASAKLIVSDDGYDEYARTDAQP